MWILDTQQDELNRFSDGDVFDKPMILLNDRLFSSLSCLNKLLSSTSTCAMRFERIITFEKIIISVIR